MIEEITIFSFSKYGKVQNFSPKKLSGGYAGNVIEIMPESYCNVNSSNYEVFIRPIDGLGIIFFDSQFKGKKYFLFDRQISINPGISFGIIAYEQVFKYEIFSKENIKSIPDDTSCPAFVPGIFTKKLLAAFYQDKSLDFDVKNQTREFCQLIYVSNGDMKCTIDSKNYLLNENDCIFIMPGQIYSLSANESRTFALLYMIFDIDIDNPDIFINHVYSSNVHMKHIFSEIIFEVRREDEFKENIISCYIPIIINAIKRENRSLLTAKNMSSSRKSINVTVENCIRIISDNINGDLSVPTIAKYLHISPSYLSKIFKDEKGTNLSEYIRDYRLEMSTELIKECKYSLSEIADMVGFCSINYFSSQFKIKYGMPPKEYFKTLFSDNKVNNLFDKNDDIEN